MRFTTKTPFRLLLLLSAAVVAMTACDQGPVGIFASIEREVAIQEGNLPKKVAVNGMVEFDLSGTGDDVYYFAAVGGRVRFRRADGTESDWATIANPPGYDGGSRPTSIVRVGDIDSGTIYVSFIDSEGKRSGIFTLDPGTRAFALVGTESSGGERLIQRLFAVSDELFAATVTPGTSGTPTHDLRHVALPTGTPVSIVVTDQSEPFIGAATDDTNNWFVTTKALFENLSASPDNSATEISIPSEARETSLGGIAVFNDGVQDFVYLSSRSGSNVTGGSTGRIARAPVGDDLSLSVSWTPITQNDRAFTGFGAANLNSVSTILVGTYRTFAGSRSRVASPGGFMEIPEGTLAGIRRPAGNSYVAADFSKASVFGFFASGEPEFADTVFVLTPGTGLWRGDYGGPEPVWVWE